MARALLLHNPAAKNAPEPTLLKAIARELVLAGFEVEEMRSTKRGDITAFAAAAEAEGAPCLPGALEDVLGVGLDWDLPREEWRWQDGQLIASGYLPRDYDPLTLNPFLIKKLLYNPRPLGKLIGRAYLEALKDSVKVDDSEGEYVGRRTMEILERMLDATEIAPAVASEPATVST